MERNPTSAKLAQKLNNPILNQNHIYMRNLFPFFRTRKTTTTDRPTDRPTAIAGKPWWGFSICQLERECVTCFSCVSNRGSTDFDTIYTIPSINHLVVWWFHEYMWTRCMLYSVWLLLWLWKRLMLLLLLLSLLLLRLFETETEQQTIQQLAC